MIFLILIFLLLCQMPGCRRNQTVEDLCDEHIHNNTIMSIILCLILYCLARLVQGRQGGLETYGDKRVLYFSILVTREIKPTGHQNRYKMTIVQATIAYRICTKRVKTQRGVIETFYCFGFGQCKNNRNVTANSLCFYQKMPKKQGQN